MQSDHLAEVLESRVGNNFRGFVNRDEYVLGSGGVVSQCLGGGRRKNHNHFNLAISEIRHFCLSDQWSNSSDELEAKTRKEDKKDERKKKRREKRMKEKKKKDKKRNKFIVK